MIIFEGVGVVSESESESERKGKWTDRMDEWGVVGGVCSVEEGAGKEKRERKKGWMDKGLPL